MAEVTDAELDEVARRVRAHNRRSSFAKMAGVGVALGAVLIAALIRMALPAEVADAIGNKPMIGLAMVGLAAGAFVNNRLEPKGDPLEDE